MEGFFQHLYFLLSISSVPVHSIIVEQKDVPEKFSDLQTLKNILQYAYTPNKERLSTCVNQSKYSDITFKLIVIFFSS